LRINAQRDLGPARTGDPLIVTFSLLASPLMRFLKPTIQPGNFFQGPDLPTANPGCALLISLVGRAGGNFSFSTENFLLAIFLAVFIFSGQIHANAFDRLPIAVQTGLGILVLLCMIPGFSLHVRRLHDQNRSGWWILLSAIPFVGHFIMLMLMLWSGTPGDNRFGNNPRHK
jgi:uncharacterized membrane protein YhaH (DUF805 family)